MSEDTIKDAKIAALNAENMQMLTTIQNWSGLLRSRKQSMDELFEANINLRSTMFLTEDKIKKLENDNAQLFQRLQALESENASLKQVSEN